MFRNSSTLFNIQRRLRLRPIRVYVHQLLTSPTRQNPFLGQNQKRSGLPTTTTNNTCIINRRFHNNDNMNNTKLDDSNQNHEVCRQPQALNRSTDKDFDKKGPVGIEHKSKIFVSQPNLVTGKMDWVLQDENYDFTQEIARSGYGDMLHDTDRNVKYFEAIQKTVAMMKLKNTPVHVFDIGTGTGLLSMMAVSAGADSVTACEAFPPMADCAKKVMTVNKVKDMIRLIPKRSTEVIFGEDMPRKANLLVTELFDTELIGEGAIGSYTDALTRLMEEDCLAVPSRGRIYIQAVQCHTLRSCNDLQPLILPNGKSMCVPESFSHCNGAPSLHDLQVDELEDELIFVSEPVEVFSFDFSKIKGLKKKEYNEQKVEAVINGQVDAFVMWWDLDMDPQGDIVLSCKPKWLRDREETIPWRDHWMQAVYYPSAPLTTSKGDKFSVHCSHDEYSLWFDTAMTDGYRPVCTCGLHIALSRNRIGQLNDQKRNDIFLNSLKKHITSSTVCLVISDGSLLPIMAASLGALKIFYLDTNPSCRKIIKQITETNNLQCKIKVLDKDAEDLTSADFSDLKIDVVIAEPYFQASSLPWEHLYFWYAASTLKCFLSPNVIILPESMEVKAMGLKFRDLHKIRIPVGNCEGFDISEFDKLIQTSSNTADPEIEPQPLWEYPAAVVTPPYRVLSLDFTHPVDQTSVVEHCAKLKLLKNELANGIGFWTEFNFGDDLWISTGISREDQVDVNNDNWPSRTLKWDKFCKQGVSLFRKESTAWQDDTINLKATFTPQSGDVSINFVKDSTTL